MARYDSILSVVEDYSTDDLVSLVSAINSWDGSLEDQDWRPMDLYSIYECCDSFSIFESFLTAAADGDFNPRDDYYRWGYYDGGLESSDCPDFDLSEIAEWIDDNFDEIFRALPDYFIRDFESLGEAEETYDDSDYPDDPTDYDGVDDVDEDPEPAEGSREVLSQTECIRLFRERVIGAEDWVERLVIEGVNLAQYRYMLAHGGQYAPNAEAFVESLRTCFMLQNPA